MTGVPTQVVIEISNSPENHPALNNLLNLYPMSPIHDPYDSCDEISSIGKFVVPSYMSDCSLLCKQHYSCNHPNYLLLVRFQHFQEQPPPLTTFRVTSF